MNAPTHADWEELRTKRDGIGHQLASAVTRAEYVDAGVLAEQFRETSDHMADLSRLIDEAAR